MLSGLLGGSLFSRGLLTSIQAWTSTSTSLVTRRQGSLFLKTILKNRVLLLKPTPPLHYLFPLLMPNFLCSFPPACMSTSTLFFLRILVFVGPGTQDICSLSLNKNSFFYFIFSLLFFFLYFCWAWDPRHM